jgi:hypothetical protein
MQRIRDDLADYVGEAGYLFTTLEQAGEIISGPFPGHRRQLGFEQAWRSDAALHLDALCKVWDTAC